MKILKANNPEPGRIPAVVALKDLSNLKLRDNYNPETMNGRTKRYNTYLKDSFDKEGMRDPIKITRVDKLSLLFQSRKFNLLFLFFLVTQMILLLCLLLYLL